MNGKMKKGGINTFAFKSSGKRHGLPCKKLFPCKKKQLFSISTRYSIKAEENCCFDCLILVKAENKAMWTLC